MADYVAHRGPDGDGFYQSPSKLYEVAFRRLSIIDLTSGDQPLIDDRSSRVLVGNGEIYNFLELRRQYADYPFKTAGDMEAVLAAFEAKGEDFLEQLNGMFALALYDTDAHCLYLARDRLGVKPLYYAECLDGSLVFASEIKPLFASNLLRPMIDTDQVSAYLAHGYVPGPATLFKGVKKLQPGHVAKIKSDGSINIQRYWTPITGQRCISNTDDAVPYLTELLDDSVRLQMRSDVPIGALLSGGLDSGMIVALAAKHASAPLNTFTIRFEGAAADEGPLACEVAERYGCAHEEIWLRAGTVEQDLPRLAWYAEEPLNDAALAPNFLVEQALSQHIKVALNGTGGDELFAGYGRYFQKPIERQFLRLPEVLRRTVISPLVNLFDPMIAWRLARAEKYFSDPGGYVHEHSTQFPLPILKLIGSNLSPSEMAQRRYADEIESDRQSRSMWSDVKTYLPDDLLTLLDRTSMAVSVEARVPFLDHRLVEAAFSISAELRTPGQRQKWLERQLATPFLPNTVLKASKQGFASPVPTWMASGLGEQANRILTRQEALDRGWWTRQGIERLVQAPARHGFRVYTLLMLELAIIALTESPLSTEPPDKPLSAFA